MLGTQSDSRFFFYWSSKTSLVQSLTSVTSSLGYCPYNSPISAYINGIWIWRYSLSSHHDRMRAFPLRWAWPSQNTSILINQCDTHHSFSPSLYWIAQMNEWIFPTPHLYSWLFLNKPQLLGNQKRIWTWRLKWFFLFPSVVPFCSQDRIWTLTSASVCFIASPFSNHYFKTSQCTILLPTSCAPLLSSWALLPS